MNISVLYSLVTRALYLNNYQGEALIGESLGLVTKSTETLGLDPVSYKILEVVSSRMKIFQTVLSGMEALRGIVGGYNILFNT